MGRKCLFLAGVLTIVTNSILSQPTETVLGSWSSEATGTLIERTAILPEGADAGAVQETVIYLQNLSSPRVGTEPDVDIINSFLADGMLVITMDYGEHAQARVPFLNRDLFNIRDQILNDQTDGVATRFPVGYEMDAAHIFIVPGGCRLLRDLIYYDNSGTLYGMDVIYPSNPVIPVGSLVQFSADNVNRMGNFSMAFTHDSILSGQASEGFAVAMADHPVQGGYSGIDPVPQSAWIVRAAVRAMRGQSASLGLNGRVATMGFSRGSGVALMAVTTELVDEWYLYLSPTTVIPIAEASVNKGTYPSESASVQGAVIMSGRFTYIDLLEDDPNLGTYTDAWGSIESNYDRWEYHGAIDFLTADPGYPLFLTINNDDKHAHHQMDVLKTRLDGFGAEYLFFEDTEEPLAHRMPLVHSVLNEMNRYLRSVLMDPSPDTAIDTMAFIGQNIGGGTIRFTSVGLVPPVDYGLQSSSTLSGWSVDGTVRPRADGYLEFDLDTSGGSPVFYQIASPADPPPAPAPSILSQPGKGSYNRSKRSVR
ncbi:MAG: hypothetical protein AB3N64_03375 [Puniceicoccaceae bacterium]